MYHRNIKNTLVVMGNKLKEFNAMKKLLYVLIASVVAACFMGETVLAAGKSAKKVKKQAPVEQTEQAEEAEPEKAVTTKTGIQLPFVVYQDGESRKNHFSPSGWMGDYSDLRIMSSCKDKPHSGTSCFKITYSAKMAQNAGWTGIYWQHPMSNWGDKKGGFNLTGAKKLAFWARGEKGGETITEFKMGGITGEFGDSDMAMMGPVTLTNEWQQYSIDLEGKDLSYVIGGFCFSASKDDNPEGFIVYLDDIAYE
jgi:hypothetical protein